VKELIRQLIKAEKKEKVSRPVLEEVVDKVRAILEGRVSGRLAKVIFS